jgi:hypothetical protein
VITIVCPLNSAPQSLTCVLRWVNILGDAVDYLVVKNDRDQGGFAHLDSTAGKEFREKYKPTIIEIPYRNPDIYNILEGLNLSPGRAIELFNLAEQGDLQARDQLGVLADDSVLMAQLEVDLNDLFILWDQEINLILP